jgi:cobalt ECF transporter T component CbiQ
VGGQVYSHRLDHMIEDYQNAGIKDGWHHWDARIKLLLVVAAIALNVVVAQGWLSITLLVISLFFIARSRIPLRLLTVFFLAPALGTLVVFAGFSIGFGMQPLFSIGPVTVFREGVELGSSAAARVASEISWTATLMLTTPLPRLMEALRFYRMPQALIDAIAMAYRYAFLLADEFYRMIAAARVRGGLKGFYGKLQSTAMILAQVVLRAYDRAARLQQAMTARGANNAHTVASEQNAEKLKAEVAEGCLSSSDRHYDSLMPVAVPGALVLECQHLSFAYKSGGAKTVDDLSLTVGRGEVAALCGPNGCGKSTFLKLVAGVLKPSSGEIMLLGTPLDKAHRDEAFRLVGLLFQDPNDQVFCTHVHEDVAYGPRNMGEATTTVDALARAAMALAEITHLAQRSVHQLSAGEMKRIGLAGLIAMRQPLMLLDEPSAYLDPAATRQMVQIVRRLNSEYGYTFIVVTHDMELAAELASRALIMQDGRILADGSPRQILTNQALLKAARLEPPVLSKLFSEVNLADGDERVAPPITMAEAKAFLEKLNPPRRVS